MNKAGLADLLGLTGQKNVQGEKVQKLDVFADGVRLHGFCTPKYIKNVIWPQLQVGLDRAVRSRESLQISGGREIRWY